VLTGEETQKLARLVGDLMANDDQFAAALPAKEVCERIVHPDLGWAALMRTVAEGYVDRPALGQRATEVVPTTSGPQSLRVLPRFDTITYGELWQRVTAVAAALAEWGVKPGDRIATLGFASIDYTTVDMAVPLLGAVSVPLHAGAPTAQLQPIVEETQPSVIACSAEYLDEGVTLALGVQPAVLVIFDHQAEVDCHRESLQAARRRLDDAHVGVRSATLAQTIERGSRLPDLPDPATDDDRLAVIIYTSGSSGSPKGAMQPESLAKSVWTVAAGVLVERGFAIPAITFNYMPMSHTAGRAMLYSTLGAGGTAYFAGASDLSTLLDDLRLVRPTQLNFVPRVWEMLYREFLLKCRRSGGATTEDEVLADMRSRLLGGRYISALTGSAPISAELATWVEKLLGTHLMDAFGATESGSVIVDGTVQRPPVTDYKLVDVPELGYYSTDKPYPRGELLLKSQTLFSGYYRRPELTTEVFDDDGFYRTGDVVAEIGPDQLRYVDRRNNVLKLAQGEFVTVSKLEAIYTNCELVYQIYVYGSSERAFLLAVVVPTEPALASHETGDLKRLILRSFQEAARDAALEQYEIPRDIIIEPSPFTLDNGLLSGIRKPSRPNLKARYGAQLEQLYAELAEAQSLRMRDLTARSGNRAVIDTVRGVAGSLLGALMEDPPVSAKFTELGGDSLSALTFANTLERIFDVAVPVGTILSPASDLQTIADYIEIGQTPDRTRPTFASVHGAQAVEVNARELTLDKFIDAETIERAASLVRPSHELNCVLLTGATGYLGRYLLLDWLERMAAVDGMVICLVRGRDDAAARQRLDAVFDSGDPALLTRYTTLAANHLEVFAGDKGEARLGLRSEAWQRLADCVDLIIDPAALVNHMLPYSELFGPNVVGTAELIRLALTQRMKPIAFVSSIGVGATIPIGQFTEDADVRRVSATRAISDDYASGYANSKWAGEVLLREAFDLCGLPATVFRCDMIMAEPAYRGQLNLPDMVTRLILSVAATGLAPASFYLSEVPGKRPRAHFDGLPVDFVTEAISTLTVTNDPAEFRTFHVINPHDDGVGLDEYVDWMMQAGCRIERITEYSQWFARFGTALPNLPEPQRHASLLPILDSFRHPQPAVAGAFAPTPRFQEAVARSGIGVSGDIPRIDSTIIRKYLSDLELLGLLDTDSRDPPSPVRV
jgi:fatty acid CoA ligase FadD9